MLVYQNNELDGTLSEKWLVVQYSLSASVGSKQ
jgi:hypothetical protein